MNARRGVQAVTLPALALLLFANGASAQASYVVKDLGVLPGTDEALETSSGKAVNSSGHVAGWASYPDERWHAFFHDGTTMIDIHPPQGFVRSFALGINEIGDVVLSNGLNPGTMHGCGARYRSTTGTFLYLGGLLNEHNCPPGSSVPRAINNNNSQIVGLSETFDADENPVHHAFLYSGGEHGTYLDLGTLWMDGTNLGNSDAYALNDVGTVVGDSEVWSGGWTGVRRAFCYSGTSMTSLGTLGGSWSRATSVNNAGFIVGYSAVDSYTDTVHAFLATNGQLLDLGTLGGASTFAQHINNYNEIVGYSGPPGSAFSYVAGTMRDLNDLLSPSSGWTLRGANGISDAGHITGWGDHSGLQRAYLLTPGALAPSGSGVLASIGTQVTLLFANVATAGTVTGVRVPDAHCQQSGNFQTSFGTCYDLTKQSSLSFSAATICIRYDPSAITSPEALLRIKHYNGTSWDDITVLPVDTVNHSVCGSTSSLSRFAVAQPTYTQAPFSVGTASVQYSGWQRVSGLVQLRADFGPKIPASADVVTGIFDGVTLFSVPFSRFGSAAQTGKYQYVRKGLIVDIDFGKREMFVSAPNVALAGLDNSDGVDLQFIIDGPGGMQIGFQHIVMTEMPDNRLVYEP
jgi:probable HAF family extracellular repeat protein